MGWKVPNSMGMKGRQSVWRKRKTERARLAGKPAHETTESQVERQAKPETGSWIGLS